MIINAYCDTVNLSKSITGQLLDDTIAAFNFSYGSGDVFGGYITDDVAVGGASLTNVIIGLALDDTNEDRGILGVGLPADEVPGIPSHAGVLELLVQQGYISSTSYSLYLDRYSKLSL